MLFAARLDAGINAVCENPHKKHQDLYYNAEPEISDADFDCLWDELRAIDPENALFQTVPQESAERARPI